MLHVNEDMTLNDAKALVESELKAPPSTQYFLHNGQPVTDTSKTFAQLQIGDGDLLGLLVQNRRPETDNSARQASSANTDVERLRLQILGDASLRDKIRKEMPEFVDAASDKQRFNKLYTARQKALKEEQRNKEEELARLQDNIFDPEAQTKIAEMIRIERVQENLQKAMEEFPEAFGQVIMLYIDVYVNNVPIKAFVDSGAQTTIMSPDAAERCGITYLVDKRWGGIARGVGTAKILGRVHSADIQIGQYSLASTFTVMEGKDVDLLLGLDTLKRHQMSIDLKENCLRVQNDKIPFLPESEIPKMMQDILENEPKVDGPDGAKIGATTGTIELPSPQQDSVMKDAAPPSVGNAAAISGTATSATSNSTSQPKQQNPGQYAFTEPISITEQSIALITDLGFSREEAIAALQAVGGDVEMAIGYLL